MVRRGRETVQTHWIGPRKVAASPSGSCVLAGKPDTLGSEIAGAPSRALRLMFSSSEVYGVMLRRAVCCALAQLFSETHTMTLAPPTHTARFGVLQVTKGNI